ncbi:MAG: TolB family protein, partial [Cuspidothrix sp.]
MATSVNPYSVKSSGSNYVWVTTKGANSVLNLYNGTTTLPIANSTYSGFDVIPVGSLISSTDTDYLTALSNISISGNTVVYAKKDGNDYEIYRYSGGTTTKLTNNTINDYAPQIAGNTVVWYANYGTDVEIFRNNGTTTTQLTNNGTDEKDLKLSGSNAVWVGWDGNDYEIYLNNGTTTTQLTNNTTDDYSPVISDNKVAWFHWNGTAENLFFYNGTTTTQITNNIEVYNPLVSGDKVVYSKYNGTNYSLQLYNGTTNTTTQLASQLSSKERFKIDGNWVVWADTTTNSNGFADYTLKLYNGTSTVTLDSSFVDNFTVANNKVAWLERNFNSYSSDIFLYDGTTTTQITAGLDYNSYNLTIVGNNVLSTLY